MSRIDYKHWLSLNYWTFEQAAYLFAGIDPNDTERISMLNDPINSYYWINQKSSSNPINKFRRLLQTFKQSDWGSESDENLRASRANVESYFELAKEKQISIPKGLERTYMTLLGTDSPATSPMLELSDETSGHFSQKTIDAFDDYPIKSIAKILPLEKDEAENLSRWKKYATKATRNGLDSARIRLRSGKSPSTFNPAAAANWVIARGYIQPDFVERKLSRSLPDRSKHLREDLFPDYE
jgi:hypothetical protein